MSLRSGDPTAPAARGLSGSRRGLLRIAALGMPMLVVGALVGVGAHSAPDRAATDRTVLAAGQAIGEVVPPPASLPPDAPAPTLPPTTAKAAPTSAPAATIARPSTTIARPTTTTTRAIRPTTSLTAPVGAAPVASTAPVSGQAMVTLRNSYSEAVQLKVNGETFQLAAGQQLGPVPVTPAASGNDIIELRVSANLGCGEGDADGYFVSGHRYLLTVATGPGGCPPSATSPGFTVTPA